ncbi:hypothetical protein ACWGRV_27040 [Streptomyces sp. NPDC055663]
MTWPRTAPALIAADHEQSSVCQQAVADRLTAEGHPVAAGTGGDGEPDSPDFAYKRGTP